MTTTTHQTTPSHRRRRRLSRAFTLVIGGGLISGAAFAVATGIAAATRASTSTTAWSSTSSRSASNPWSGWGSFAPRGRVSGPSGPSEHFVVESIDPAGPGAIIITGPINAGGSEYPGRALDNATFADGSFRIDHSAGHPTSRFDAKTCVGTITQTGPFRVYDGTGRFSRFNGSGVYRFDAVYTTARDAAGCAKKTTAYLERIDGTIPLGPSVARSIASSATP